MKSNTSLEPEESIEDLSSPANRSFFARYNKIICLVYGAVTISAAVLFSFLYSNNYEAMVQLVNLRLFEQTQAFNNVLRVRYDAVKAMQRQARRFLLNDHTLFKTPGLLRDIPELNSYYLVGQNGEGNPESVLVGRGSSKNLSPLIHHEQQMACSLMPLVSVLRNQIQSVVNFHYTSAQNFYFLYPKAQNNETVFDPSVYEREYYKRSLPDNPDEDNQQVFWTDIYQESGSSGTPLITCAAPVYLKREYKGVVAIDFTLASVDVFLKSIYHRFGHFLVVNDFDTVIAEAKTKVGTIIPKVKKNLSEVIPKDLPLDLKAFDTENGLTQVGGYWVFVADTDFAPWKIVFYIAQEDITFETLKHILPGLLMVLMFTTLFLIGTNRLIANEFIEPTKLLVDHIVMRGNQLITSDQNLRAPWTGWFNAISNVFEENRALVGKMERHILKLDEKVVQRTKDLSRNNLQLQKTLDELKKAQNQIITQEKLAGLGALTAGIAHEIRNPLNFIINFAETSRSFSEEFQELIAKTHKKPSAQAWEDLEDLARQLLGNMEKITEHGRRADAIVHSMLTHARGGEEHPQSVDLHTILEENIVLCLAGFKRHGFSPRIEQEFDDNLGMVTVYPQDLGRVFLNIINNACYAMQEKLKANPDYEPVIRIQTEALDDHFRVKIHDNGPGIPKELRRKIFNPFFTTKPSGEGTGLGLSLGFDIIVNQHQGNLEINSELNSHTEFVLTLPCVTKDIIN